MYDNQFSFICCKLILSAYQLELHIAEKQISSAFKRHQFLIHTRQPMYFMRYYTFPNVYGVLGFLYGKMQIRLKVGFSRL